MENAASTDNIFSKELMLKIYSLIHLGIMTAILSSCFFIFMYWFNYRIIYSIPDGLTTFLYLLCLFCLLHTGIAVIIGLPMFLCQRLIAKLKPDLFSAYIPELMSFFGIISYYSVLPQLILLQKGNLIFSDMILLNIGIFLLLVIGSIIIIRKIKVYHSLNRGLPAVVGIISIILAVSGLLLINALFPKTYMFSEHYRNYPSLQFENNNIPGNSKSPEQLVKNIILVSYDALRPDHLSYFGYSRKTSPFLDELMSKSASFHNVTASYPATSQSFASLFTGLYPWSHGIWNTNTALSESMFTLAEELKIHGYNNYGIVSNIMLDPIFNFNQGFDKYLSLKKTDPVSVTDAVLNLIDKGIRDPFFLWVHYLDPHSPYDAYDKYVEIYKTDPTYKKDLNPANYRKKVYGSGATPSAEVVANAVTRYDGEINNQDEQLKRLFNHLYKEGYLDDSLLIFTSDHGEYFGHHGYYFNHGPSPYRELQVPLAFYKPGVILPRRYDEPVELLDVVPTMLSLMGIKPVKMKLAGIDLSDSLVKGPDKSKFPRSYAMGLAYATDEKGYPQFFILRSKEWELIVNKMDHVKRINTFGQLLEFSKSIYEFRGQGVELYNINEDPMERDNLASEKPDITNSMLNALGGKLVVHEKETGKAHTQLKEKDLDSATIKKLKTLGYIN